MTGACAAGDACITDGAAAFTGTALLLFVCCAPATPKADRKITTARFLALAALVRVENGFIGLLG
jgi:hypothetical protein